MRIPRVLLAQNILGGSSRRNRDRPKGGLSREREGKALRTALPPRLADQLKNVLGRRRNIRPGAKDRGNASLFQEIIILLWNNPATDHNDIPRALRLQLFDQLRRKRLMPGSLG